jgi:hypothetical protein
LFKKHKEAKEQKNTQEIRGSLSFFAPLCSNQSSAFHNGLGHDLARMDMKTGNTKQQRSEEIPGK